jgi:hypothetical protein
VKEASLSTEAMVWNIGAWQGTGRGGAMPSSNRCTACEPVAQYIHDCSQKHCETAAAGIECARATTPACLPVKTILRSGGCACLDRNGDAFMKSTSAHNK